MCGIIGQALVLVLRFLYKCAEKARKKLAMTDRKANNKKEKNEIHFSRDNL
jgi:hypothetical protein